MFNPELLHPELWFKAVRSGGKGGQHVNKVSSRVELYFDVARSIALHTEQKMRILNKWANHINNEGILIIDSQETRSQYRNKEAVIQKFDEMIRAAFVQKKKRIKTKPSERAKAKRLEGKKRQGEKKISRRNDWRSE
jgi:ribosome-associated protein